MEVGLLGRMLSQIELDNGEVAVTIGTSLNDSMII
jgi:hypothetical protein